VNSFWKAFLTSVVLELQSKKKKIPRKEGKCFSPPPTSKKKNPSFFSWLSYEISQILKISSSTFKEIV